MPANNSFNDRRTDPDLPAVPATVVADIDSRGDVTIYDERLKHAWISSTYAISLQQIV